MITGDKVRMSPEWYVVTPTSRIPPDRVGTIVAHSRDRTCAIVKWPGLKKRNSYSLKFLEVVPE